MRKTWVSLLLIGIFFTGGMLAGCASTAQTQFYLPANYSGDPYRIAGTLEPMQGWNGVLTITINEQEVIRKPLPVFSNTTDAYGTFDGEKVSTTITKVTTFTSSFMRADVFIGAEKAATLTF